MTEIEVQVLHGLAGDVVSTFQMLVAGVSIRGYLGGDISGGFPWGIRQGDPQGAPQGILRAGLRP